MLVRAAVLSAIRCAARPLAALIGLLAVAASAAQAEPGRIPWRALQRGVELAVVELGTQVPYGDNRLVVTRIDPRVARIEVALASARGRRPHTAAEWCGEAHLAVAINAGMFRDDGLSNVGHLVDGDHVNSARWVGPYRSALGLSPREAGLPPAVMVDLDDPGAREQLAHYRTVIQNLRLIRSVGGKGSGVWQEQKRRWSEAAVAVDGKGRVLFLFTRTPYSMAEWGRLVLSLPLDIRRAMHVEGGPEASLSIHAGGVDADYYGSFETEFVENDGNDRSWPIPNVLGVARKP
jgi:hypothetical protein